MANTATFYESSTDPDLKWININLDLNDLTIEIMNSICGSCYLALEDRVRHKDLRDIKDIVDLMTDLHQALHEAETVLNAQAKEVAADE